MDSEELTEWMQFYNLEPFGGDTAYIGHAIVAATVANTHRAKGKKAAKVEDYMPRWKPKKAQTVEEQIQLAQMWTAALGGQDLRGEGE